MTVRSLSKQIAIVRKTIAARIPARPVWLTPSEWIVQFEEWERAGHFRHEPDLPKALAFYRDALAQVADPSLQSRIIGDPEKRREPALLECVRIAIAHP